MRQVVSLVLFSAALGKRVVREVEFCDNSLNVHTDETGACVENVCACEGGVAVANADCTSHGNDECASCTAPLEKNNNNHCQNAVADIDDGDHAPCDNAANMHRDGNGDCVENVCGCDNGNAVANADCKSHGLNMCASCDDGFQDPADNNGMCFTNGPESCADGEHFEEGSGCVANVCECSNGDADADCAEHGRERCTSCDPGFIMEPGGNMYCLELVCAGHQHLNGAGDGCDQNVCTCANGDAHTGGACQENNAESCDGCDEGYHKRDGTCQAIP